MRPGAQKLLEALLPEPLDVWNRALLSSITWDDSTDTVDAETVLDVIHAFVHLARSAHPGALTYFQTLTEVHAEVWLQCLEVRPGLSTDELIERVRLLVMCLGPSPKLDHVVDLAWAELDRRGLGSEVRQDFWCRRREHWNFWG